MKRSRLKIAAVVLSAALMFTIGGMVGTDVKGAKATVTTAGKSTSLSIQKLREIATQIIKGKIVSQQYDFEIGRRVVEFDIIDANGIKREISLYTDTGKVHDIDYDYDAQGNRFINQNLFEVNFSFEQAQQKALARVSGKVLAHKQDVENGLFIYEFMIQSKNGIIYEVDVETKTGKVIKVEADDDFNLGAYALAPVQVQQTVAAPAPAPQAGTSKKSEAQLRKIVLGRFPGKVVWYDVDYDDGMLEYEYKIRQGNGMLLEVKITEFGWITDVDYDD